jgi:hypothetical protein
MNSNKKRAVMNGQTIKNTFVWLSAHTTAVCVYLSIC